MAIAGGAKPSARCTIVNGNLVVDAFQMRSGDVLSTPYQAIDKLRNGQVEEWTSRLRTDLRRQSKNSQSGI